MVNPPCIHCSKEIDEFKDNYACEYNSPVFNGIDLYYHVQCEREEIRRQTHAKIDELFNNLST